MRELVWDACSEDIHMWVAYLIASPTRSSFVGVAPIHALAQELAAHNGEDPENEPPETVIGRPWKFSGMAERPTRKLAERCAWSVSQASGFRARYAELLRCQHDEPSDAAGQCAYDRERALDGLTYAMVKFVNPRDESRHVTVRALVDTGSNDCELRAPLIETLGLPRLDGNAHFETAAGITITNALYRAKVTVMGRTSGVLLSPAEGSEDSDEGSSSSSASEEEESEGEEDFDELHGFDSTSDDAMLGHDALAALGLAVDCRRRRLVPLPE